MRKITNATTAELHAALRELGYATADDSTFRASVLSFQQAWRLRPTGELDERTTRTLVDVHDAHTIAQRHGHAAAWVARGRVTSAADEPAPNLAVQLIRREIGGEAILAVGSTDADGRYT